MRIRPRIFYVITAKRGKNDEQVIEVDAATPDEVVCLVCELFGGKFSPTKDENGKFHKGQPYSKLFVNKMDKDTHASQKLTSGFVYNLTPSQIINRITEAVKK